MSEKLTAEEIIVKVMNDVQGLAKKDKNTQQGFVFRGIDAVMNAVGPALRAHGGFIIPRFSEAEYSQIPSRNGGNLNVARVQVSYSVHGQTGDPIVGSVVAEAFDSGDKATAKAMSVAYRTFLLQLLCLPTDEPDPDTYSYETVASPEKPVEVPEDFDAKLLSVYDLKALQELWESAVAGGYSEKVKSVVNARKKEIQQ